MLTGLYLNLAITGVCVILIGYYFNIRENQIHRLASVKIRELQNKYNRILDEKKHLETEELDKLKGIASELEEEYKKMRVTKRSISSEEHQTKQALEIAKAHRILREAKIKADTIVEQAVSGADKVAEKYLEDKKKEIETKIVDLVIAISKKVLSSNIEYKDHKKAIEAAFLEMEGKLK